MRTNNDNWWWKWHENRAHFEPCFSSVSREIQYVAQQYKAINRLSSKETPRLSTKMLQCYNFMLFTFDAAIKSEVHMRVNTTQAGDNNNSKCHEAKLTSHRQCIKCVEVCFYFSLCPSGAKMSAKELGFWDRHSTDQIEFGNFLHWGTTDQKRLACHLRPCVVVVVPGAFHWQSIVSGSQYRSEWGSSVIWGFEFGGIWIVGWRAVLGIIWICFKRSVMSCSINAWYYKSLYQELCCMLSRAGHLYSIPLRYGLK